MTCRCGCNRPVRPGNTYASQGCSRRHRAAGKGPGWTVIAKPPQQPQTNLWGDSWWMGKSRAELNQEAQKFARGERPRFVMNDHGLTYGRD